MTVSVKQTTLRAEVVKADPDWVRTRNNVVEYEFSNGRKFRGNVPDRGLYGDTFLPGDYDNPLAVANGDTVQITADSTLFFSDMTAP